MKISLFPSITRRFMSFHTQIEKFIQNEFIKCLKHVITRERLGRLSWDQRVGARTHRWDHFICWKLKIG
jgi:hypothetical protein